MRRYYVVVSLQLITLFLRPFVKNQCANRTDADVATMTIAIAAAGAISPAPSMFNTATAANVVSVE